MLERLYYSNSFLSRFDAVVTDIRLISRIAGEARWQLALDRSAFYPTSGGQPCDKGTLAAASRSGAVLEVPIDTVEEDKDGEVWHFTAKPLLAGTPVHAAIDWGRRLDHMQQHSGQHLLSAILSRELAAHTLSFHLGDESSTIDLNTVSVVDASLERIERLANEIIAEDRPFSLRTVRRTEAEAMLAAGALRKLPEREGDIRLVEIEGIDLNACGGTHVRSTGQIGGLALRSMEKVRGGLRLEFVCGLRAMKAARKDFNILAATAASLSVGREALLNNIERMIAESKHAAKERLKLREQLAEFEAWKLLEGSGVESGILLVRHVSSSHDAEYMQLLALRVVAGRSRTVALLASRHSEPACVVMARSIDLDFSCGERMKGALTELGLRGGGSPTLAQGRLPGAALDSFLDRLALTAR